MSNGKNLSGKVAAAILIVATALMIPAAMYLPRGSNFLGVIALMVLFVVTLGIHIAGRPAGILINEQNLVGLSRFQMVIWTLIILPAYLTMALERIRVNVEDPLAIAMDWRLWALMGISTTSLVGTPLIHSSKKNKDPKPEEMDKTASALNEDKATIAANKQGVLYANSDITEASFTDIFQGDEVGNTAFIDLAKTQMFFFTVVAALSYAVVLFVAIKTKAPAELSAFPELSEGLIAILGISHAGYLVNKTTDHTSTT